MFVVTGSNRSFEDGASLSKKTLFAGYFACLLLLIVSSLASAAPANMVARHYRSIDGMPVSSATNAVIDADGFLWLATHDGLARFDGRQFTVYDAARFPDMGGNRIAAVYRDRGDVIYALGAGGEWLRVSSQHIQRIRPDAALPEDRVRHVHPDPLCVTMSRGMYCADSEGMRLRRSFDDGADVRLAIADGDRDWLFVLGQGVQLCDAKGCELRWASTSPTLIERPELIGLAHNGSLWLGLQAGVLQVPADGAARWLVTAAERTVDLLQMRVESDGSLMIGTNAGLYRSLGDWQPAMPGSTGVDRLMRSWRDADGIFWYSDDGDLYREGVRVLQTAGEVTSLLFSADGLAIVTTLRDGLYILATPRVELAGDDPVLGMGNLYGLSGASDGSMWMGSLGSGLLRIWPDGRRQRYGRAEGFPGDNIWAVAQALDGTIYAASYQPGLWVLDASGKFTAAPLPAALANAQVRSFSTDAQGNFWVGSGAGAWQQTDSGWQQRWPLRDAALVQAIAHEPDGTVWYGGTLGLWRQDAHQSWEVASSLLDGVAVRNLFRSTDGAIWASSEGRGLIRVAADDRRGERALRIGRAEGLPSNSPHALVEDAQGNLWVNSNQGIFRLSREEMAEFLQGRIQVLSPLTLGLADGLTELEGNGGVQPAAAIDRAGRIWFPSQRGVVRIDPAKLPLRRTAPRAVIDGIDSQGSSVALVDARLPLGMRSVQIRYNAADLHAGSEVRFRYRLHPVDQNWTDAGTRRVAAFAALAPERYRLEVVAGNSDGFWSSHSAELEFVVPAYSHETPQFRWSLGLAVLLLMAGLAQWRLQRLRQRAVALDAQVHLRTQELSTEKARVETTLAKLANAHTDLALTHGEIEVRNRKLAEQTARLEALDRFRTRLLADVSHELRTPLMLIKLPLRELFEGSRKLLAADRQRLQLPLQQTERLSHLVEQLVGLVQAEAGQLRLKVRRIDLIGWAKGVIAGFEPIAERHQVQVELHSTLQSLPVYADVDHLTTILSNLLDNALKYAPSASVVRVAIEIDPQSDCAHVAVADRGPGYPPELADSLFDRFFRAEGAPRAGREGLGIGLALARELIELHGGRIGTAVSVDQGTVFWLDIPLGSAHIALDEVALEASSIADLPLSPAANEGGILLVEDHPELAAYLSERLAEFFPVRTVASAELAVAEMQRGDIRLLVSDVKLPGMDGVELCRTLKAQPQFAGLPVILISAKSTLMDRDAGIAAGAVTWITKPFELATLIAEIRRHWPINPDSAAEKRVPAHVAANLDDPILQIVRNKMADPAFGVAEWSDAAHLSDRQLRRRVTDLTGLSPIVWLREQRLQKVRELISSGSCQTLAEAGRQCGFDNPSYLYRLYRAQFGEG